jgi:exosortase H (IPTLxxWG-CTERM-specific)
MQAESSFRRVTVKRASGRKDMLRFLAIFLALVAAYYALTLSPWVDAHVLFPVMKASARGASATLGALGVRTTAKGVLVQGPRYAVAVRRGCDPLEPIVLFVAGVIAFPAAWRQRLPRLVGGAFFLFGLNLVRIDSLYLLGAKQSPLLDSFHLAWWPAFFILCALALWVLWLLSLRRPGSDAQPAAPARNATPNTRAPSRAGGA